MANKPLWDGQSPKKLRQPKLNLSNNTNNGDADKAGGSSLPIIQPEKSKLNVSAPEFVPRNYFDNSVQKVTPTPAISTRSVQNRLKVHKEPNNMRFNSINSYNTEGERNFHYSNDSLDDRRLKQLISTLTNNPGQFDSLLDLFKQTIRPYCEDILAISSVTDLLVTQAIQQPSFRYTGARLCYSIEQESPTFRAQLHITCERELATNPDKQGIVMFVAELYMQLYHENIYGKCLTNAFKQLLNEGGDNNIKCLCQALKLTGHSLEQYDKETLNDIMEQLANSRQFVSGTALCLLDSVINLRNAKWGYNNHESSSSEEGIDWYEEEQAAINPVFYTTEDMSLSNEERAFLAASLVSTDEFIIDNSDPDELCDPEPEMDEEIQLAFKEFVKLSKR